MYHFANLIDAQKALDRFLPSKLARPAYTTAHVAQFMNYLDNPQDKIKSVHIAGTSGKTSTAHYVAALLQQAGCPAVGLLTSPHVQSITERIRINLQPLSDSQFCNELSIFLQLADDSGISLTYAELLYAFGYWVFERQNVTYMVIETGLGGLHDATNVITREDKVCIITDIGLDHTNVLGTTLTAIAQQKAGIILPHNHVFTYSQPEAAMQQIRQAITRQQATLHTVAAEKTPRYDFLPRFQNRNFTAAYRTVQFIIARDALPLLTASQSQTAASITIPARMEILRSGKQTIILDGSHNPQKLQALQESIRQQFPERSVAVLASFIESGGRSLVAMLQALRPLAAHSIFTIPTDDQAYHKWYGKEALTAAAHEAGIESFEVISDYQQAVDVLLHRPESVLVATGSLYAHGSLRQLVSR